MKFQKLGGYHFLPLTLLLSSTTFASSDSPDQLQAKRIEIEAETERLRSANANNKIRLEEIRRKIAELLEKNRSLDRQFETESVKTEGDR